MMRVIIGRGSGGAVVGGWESLGIAFILRRKCWRRRAWRGVHRRARYSATVGKRKTEYGIRNTENGREELEIFVTQDAAVDSGSGEEGGRESFMGVLMRRGRYMVAILLSAAILFYLAWWGVMPPAGMAGSSLLAWAGSGSAVVGMLVIVVAILLAVGLSMLLTHPDAPHTGMFCAFLGLGFLAIKGGTIHLMLRKAQVAGKVADLRMVLAAECVLWGAVILAAEALTRLLFYKFYVNTAWIGRSGQARHCWKIPRN